MTKREQIEDMTKFVEQGFKNADCRQPYTNIPYPYFRSQIVAISEVLYNAGYRKIDKDSVVLKIEELEDTCNKCHWVTDYKILKRHEEEVIKLCEQEVKQAREETAKEIISFIESKDKIGGKYSIYTKLLQELKEKYLEVEE